MKRQALVVGINRYPFFKDSSTSEARHLTTAARDAEAVARLLELYGDFQVQRLPSMPDVSQLDPTGHITAEELKAAITELFNQQGSTDVGLLYFAGYGCRKIYEDGSTDSFLTTSEAFPQRNRYGVSLKWLRELLQESSVSQQIVWLDCSYSGELLQFTSKTNNQKGDRCFITAVDASETAYETDGRGVLTKALLSSLDPTKQSDGVVTSFNIKNMIEAQLRKEELHQNPVFYITGSPIILTGIKGTHWYDEHRLERLWRETADWFSNDDENSLIKHNHSYVINYFFGNPPDIKKAKSYRENVEKVLKVNLPDDWWKDTKAIEKLHKSLKYLCGAVFCGQSESGAKNLSVGSAYLVALMAYAEVFKNANGLTDEIDLAKLNQLDKPLFPIQQPDIARSSTKALYDLFFCLFSACDTGESGFRKIFFNQEGNKFTIEFTRGANEVTKEKELSLAEGLPQMLNNDYVPTPKLTNTKSAILRLWRYMLISKVGFMSPGVIYMERNKLVIASSKGTGQ